MMRLARMMPVLRAGWRRDSGERGQGAVEFVVAFPVVMMVILGIVELSIAVFAYSTIANAAQEGARYGALHPDAVAGTCANPGAGIGDAVCRLTAGLPAGGVGYAATLEDETLRVVVTYQYQAISGPMGRAIGQGGTIVLNAVAVARVD